MSEANSSLAWGMLVVDIFAILVGHTLHHPLLRPGFGSLVRLLRFILDPRSLLALSLLTLSVFLFGRGGGALCCFSGPPHFGHDHSAGALPSPPVKGHGCFGLGFFAVFLRQGPSIFSLGRFSLIGFWPVCGGVYVFHCHIVDSSMGVLHLRPRYFSHICFLFRAHFI